MARATTVFCANGIKKPPEQAEPPGGSVFQGHSMAPSTEERTAAAGSQHVPHPAPGLLGLSVGEGQDGPPLAAGRGLGGIRHRAADSGAARMRVTGGIAYPLPVSGAPTALGDGTWFTRSEAGDRAAPLAHRTPDCTGELTISQ
ncbi:hypothetical protein P3T29_006055 [Kitasatospora sp. MAP5-34]|nr:hypothetical protein [Kitasatospora sp. MAP5-34]